MIKRAELARPLTVTCALCVSASAGWAQSSTPNSPTSSDATLHAPATLAPAPDPTEVDASRPGTVQQPNSDHSAPAPKFLVLQRSEGRPTGALFSGSRFFSDPSQLDERRARLREQLADPKQRELLLKERLVQQRLYNPDLARVLRIDAGIETKLFALLVDQSLAADLRDSPFGSPGADVMQQEAENYDQQIGEITKLIGAARLDAYLDYDRTRAERHRVEAFAASLAEPDRLSAERKEALVALFAEEEARQLRESRLGIGAGQVFRSLPTSLSSPEERQRRGLLLQIYLNEQSIRQMEAADREMLERLPQVLSPAQVRAYSEQQAAQLASLRARNEQLRREVGAEATEFSPAEEFAAQSADLRLQINLTINGKASSTTSTTRGAAVSFAAPEGLWVEAEPTLLDSNNLSLELRFYESAPGGRRLVGRTMNRPSLTNVPAAAASGGNGYATFNAFNGFNSMKVVLRGRKAYLLELGVTATYL